MKRNAFELWLHARPVEKIAKQMGVGIRSVYAWRSKQHIPKLKHCKKIQKVSGGRVTVADILDYI